jgi:hypothetical protein
MKDRSNNRTNIASACTLMDYLLQNWLPSCSKISEISIFVVFARAIIKHRKDDCFLFLARNVCYRCFIFEKRFIFSCYEKFLKTSRRLLRHLCHSFYIRISYYISYYIYIYIYIFNTRIIQEKEIKKYMDDYRHIALKSLERKTGSQ